ncbi:TonB-dependent receptor [Anaeromyxobacter sp. Fw109-5]|uniref:TonB-dependent receptor n=1 Tax=Anaeromyxobacter sp. (strain Fw109-5) TaxID=404589 RepID=UPI0000ED6EC4|nr:TonB-dependent receptor [Anaeromyxobacter sp. Fw109-5]ABS28433.1 TonB-dependent receptor [Anaeromyxobacter sp. Fw109-5]
MRAGFALRRALVALALSTGVGVAQPGAAGRGDEAGDRDRTAAHPERGAVANAADSRDDEPPPDVGETVVSATRLPRPVADLPTTVLVVRSDELDRSAATTVDATLRTLPSFATLRRSTSLVADPSSQGLNLRGVAPSAVARALLLDDGVPVNDPFGGWISWRAVPRLGLERVEVAPGGASALYGSFALGGVVALVPRAIEGAAARAEAYGGSLGTRGAAVWAADRAAALGGSLEAEHAATDGYVVVAPWDRGAVDGRASARHTTVSARVLAERATGARLTLGGTFFDEEQDGGTRYTQAAQRTATARLGLAARVGEVRLDAALYGGARRFTQDRARFSADRGSEALAASQEVPSNDVGGWAVAALPPLGAHVVSAGLDLRRVSGTSRERLYPPDPAPSSPVAREASGRQWTGGLFAQDAWSPSAALELAGAARVDLWRDEEGRSGVTRADGALEEVHHAARTRAVFSPRLAARWSPSSAITVRASAYRAFRAPTLNELYRPFQVGTVLTASNPALGPETLAGGEAGPEVRLAGGLSLRATGYWNALLDPLTIVTLDAPLPDGSTRRRVNLGRARVRGLETEVAWHPSGPLALSAAWTLADSRVTSAPGYPELVGKALVHAPAHRVSGRAVLAGGRIGSAALEVRWLGRAFEDDRNTLELPGFATLDAFASRPLVGGLELFAAIENALDRRYLVGRAGVDTIGAPRAIRAGLRFAAGASGR